MTATMVRDEAPQLDITLNGDDGGVGDPLDITLGDPCKCPLPHDTESGKCDEFLPTPHGPRRIRCDGCGRDTGWIHKGKNKPKRDVPPVTVNLKIPQPKAPKVDATEQRVVDAATAWLGLVAVVLEASGDEVCGKAVKDSAPHIAAQLAVLSKFHPIIVKILAPVEASGEVLAWVSLAIAVSPIIISVLTHHKVISEEAGQRIGIFTAMGAVVGQAGPGAPGDAAD